MTSNSEAINGLEQLLAFLSQLQELKIQYHLDCARDAIMVVVPAPSKYYEIEFFADGRIERQIFGSPSPVQTMTLAEIAKAVIQDVDG